MDDWVSKKTKTRDWTIARVLFVFFLSRVSVFLPRDQLRNVTSDPRGSNLMVPPTKGDPHLFLWSSLKTLKGRILGGHLGSRTQLRITLRAGRLGYVTQAWASHSGTGSCPENWNCGEGSHCRWCPAHVWGSEQITYQWPTCNVGIRTLTLQGCYT